MCCGVCGYIAYPTGNSREPFNSSTARGQPSSARYTARHTIGILSQLFGRTCQWILQQENKARGLLSVDELS